MENPSTPEPVNLETTAQHRRQFYLQILLPLVLGAVLLLALGVLAAAGGGDRPAVWANISTIFMAILFGLSGLFSLLFLAAAIYGTNWLLIKLPPKSYLAQVYLVYFARQMTLTADKVAQSLVSIWSGWAGLGNLFKKKQKGSKEA